MSETKRRLWVISELYYPEETSTGYYMTRIAEGLADELDVRVICGQPNYSLRGHTSPRLETHKNVEIHRVAGTRLDKNVIAFRLVNMLSLGISTFVAALRLIRKGDRLLAVTTPPSMPFVAAAAALARGASYTVLIHDNYPEMLVATGKTSAGSLVAAATQIVNRWIFKHAERIIVVGRDMAQLVAGKSRGLELPIETIQNWGEIDDVRPAPRVSNELLRDLGLADKFVLLYAGNMGHPNDLESIMEAAKKLADNTRIHFVFLGTGVKRRWLEKMVGTRSLANVTVLDPRPRTEQQSFLNACDIAIVSLTAGMWGVSMPSRTYNILAAGKPILGITEEKSEIALVVEEDALGWTVPPRRPDLLAQKIEEIFENQHLLLEMGRRARLVAERDYTMGSAIAKYKKLFFS